MQAAITKDQFRALSSHMGDLDLDSGKVFTQFVGALNTRDGLYHGELRFAAPDREQTYESFSVADITGD